VIGTYEITRCQNPDTIWKISVVISSGGGHQRDTR
jgi:hypothetical protein